MKLEQQYDQVDWGQPGDIRPGSPEARGMIPGLRSSRRERERIRGSILKFTQDTR